MMALGEDDDARSVGTYMNLEASIQSAPVHDVAMLRSGAELVMTDFENITMADVNKLAGTGWKKRHHAPAAAGETTRPASPTPTAAPHAIEGQPTGAAFEVLNLQEALLRFDLDKDGKLNEREQAALYRTCVLIRIVDFVVVCWCDVSFGFCWSSSTFVSGQASLEPLNYRFPLKLQRSC
jgi:hypothetical protein